MVRLAIAEAERSPDIAEALQAGRSVNRGALAESLAKAQEAGVLGPGDAQRMMERFFGLLWGDLMTSRLLGVALVAKDRGHPEEGARGRRGVPQALRQLPLTHRRGE